MLPMLVTMASVGFVAGPLSRVLPFAAQLTLGAFLSGAAALSIALFHGEVWQLAMAAAVLGLGTGLVTSSTPNLIVRSVPSDQVGIATGMNANIRTIGGAIGTTVFAAAIGATLGAAACPPSRATSRHSSSARCSRSSAASCRSSVAAGRPARGRVIPIAESRLIEAAEAA